MKKSKREIYLVLTREIDFPLCAFCRYSETYGGDCPELGGDCWLFRPAMTVRDCADIVGVVMEHGWNEASWYTNNGITRVFGRV